MPNFRVRVRLSLDGPGGESTKARTEIYNAACEKAHMVKRGKTGGFQHDQMPGAALARLLTDLAPLANLPTQGQSVAVDHIWLHVERVLPNPADAANAD